MEASKDERACELQTGVNKLFEGKLITLLRWEGIRAVLVKCSFNSLARACCYALHVPPFVPKQHAQMLSPNSSCPFDNTVNWKMNGTTVRVH